MCRWTPRPSSGGSPGDVCPTAGTGSRWPRSWAWTSPTSGPTLWVRTRSPRCRRARSWRCGRTAPRFPGTSWGHLFSDAEREIGVLVYCRAVLVRGRGRAEDLQGQGQFGRAGADPARRPGQPGRGRPRGRRGRRRRAWPPRSATRWRCTGRCGRLDGVEFRFHRTMLYNSIYRADDQVLVNTHLFGVTAAHRPGLAPAQASRRASWPGCTSTASSGSGKRPRRWMGPRLAWPAGSTSTTTRPRLRRTAWCRRSTWW